MLGTARECSVCTSTEATIWCRADDGAIVCNECMSSERPLTRHLRKSRSVSPAASGTGSKFMRLEVQKLGDMCGTTSSSDSDTPRRHRPERHDGDTCDDRKTCRRREDEGRKEEEGRKDEEGRKEEDDECRSESTRKTRKGVKALKGVVSKGKSRRSIFKKCPVKAPLPMSQPIVAQSLMYKGHRYQLGDVVSVRDSEDGQRYFCQIRGLLQDQYCEQSAALTWLLPTSLALATETGFDPATYVIGPEEELPRTLDFLTPVCRAPCDYYHLSTAPYPTLPSALPTTGYSWANMKPVYFDGSP